MTKRLELPKFQAFDANGDPLSGGLVYTYSAGTDTAKTTYSDYDASTANANPVVLDSRGEADIYLQGSYKIVLKDSADATIWTLDNVQGGVGADAGGEDFYYPDATAADQGVTGNSDTIKYAVDTISTDSGTIYLRHSSGSATTTYTLTTSETVPENVRIIVEEGARIDGAGTLTLSGGPDQLEVRDTQTIFGSSITVSFTITGTVYPEWWGADHSTDCATEFASMIASLPSAGGTIDLFGRSFRIDSTVVLESNIKIYGGTIDFSNAALDDVLFEATGTATNTSANADIAQSDTTCDVTDATNLYTDNSWVIVEDTNDWGTNAHMGEWHQVAGTSGTTVTMLEPFMYPYKTAQTAQVKHFTFKENIILEGITATGRGGSYGNVFFYGTYCENVKIRRCELADFEQRGVRLDRCVIFDIFKNYIKSSDETGLGYGVSIQGCYEGTIAENWFIKNRHGVSIGGSEIPTRGVTIKANKVFGSDDAGLDSHDASDGVIFTNNIIRNEGASSDGDGIITQGVNTVITNNIIESCQQTGIRCQCNVYQTDRLGGYTIKGNQIRLCLTGGGIDVDQGNASTQALKNVVIEGNTIEETATFGIRLYARYDNITDVSIANNTITGISSASYQCVLLRSATGFYIRWFTATANTLNRDNDSESNFKMLGADADGVAYGTISSNVFRNGSIGIEGVNDDYLAYSGNVFVSTTLDMDIDGNHNGIPTNNAPFADFLTSADDGGTIKQNIGAVRLDSTDGKIDVTLGSGLAIGQTITIVMYEASNSSTVSITNHQTSDPEVATFNAVDETGVFMWTGTEWITIFATCTFV